MTMLVRAHAARTGAALMALVLAASPEERLEFFRRLGEWLSARARDVASLASPAEARTEGALSVLVEAARAVCGCVDLRRTIGTIADARDEARRPGARAAAVGAAAREALRAAMERGEVPIDVRRLAVAEEAAAAGAVAVAERLAGTDAAAAAGGGSAPRKTMRKFGKSIAILRRLVGALAPPALDAGPPRLSSAVGGGRSPRASPRALGGGGGGGGGGGALSPRGAAGAGAGGGAGSYRSRAQSVSDSAAAVAVKRRETGVASPVDAADAATGYYRRTPRLIRATLAIAHGEAAARHALVFANAARERGLRALAAARAGAGAVGDALGLPKEEHTTEVRREQGEGGMRARRCVLMREGAAGHGGARAGAGREGRRVRRAARPHAG